MIIFFIIIIVATIFITRKCDVDFTRKYRKTIMEWNQMACGHIVDKIEFQQHVAVIQLDDLTNEINEIESDYIVVKDNKIRFMTLFSPKFLLGDSIVINSMKDSIFIYRDGVLIDNLGFSNLNGFGKAPVYFQAKDVLDKFK